MGCKVIDPGELSDLGHNRASRSHRQTLTTTAHKERVSVSLALIKPSTNASAQLGVEWHYSRRIALAVPDLDSA